jgi:hypothetical protein
MRREWEGPWRLDRQKGEWRRRYRSPLVQELPLPPQNGSRSGAVTMVGFIVHYQDEVVKVKVDGS